MKKWTIILGALVIGAAYILSDSKSVDEKKTDIDTYFKNNAEQSEYDQMSIILVNMNDQEVNDFWNYMFNYVIPQKTIESGPLYNRLQVLLAKYNIGT